MVLAWVRSFSSLCNCLFFSPLIRISFPLTSNSPCLLSALSPLFSSSSNLCLFPSPTLCLFASPFCLVSFFSIFYFSSSLLDILVFFFSALLFTPRHRIYSCVKLTHKIFSRNINVILRTLNPLGMCKCISPLANSAEEGFVIIIFFTYLALTMEPRLLLFYAFMTACVIKSLTGISYCTVYPIICLNYYGFRRWEFQY